MRPLRHLSGRYVFDRTVLAFRRWSNPADPWLTPAATGFLSDWLRPTDFGLECGSGRSTLWFAKRSARLVSLEHHAGWYTRVSAQLRAAQMAERVDYQLHEDGLTSPSGGGYVAAIHALPDQSIDYALIDGVARDLCMAACLPKLRPGGLLVVDNVNWYWPRAAPSRAPATRSMRDGFASRIWESVAQDIGGWRSVWTSDGVTDTAFWVKPPSS